MYLLADLLVAAAPVVMLAGRVTIPRPASNASRRGVGQWGGAGGAICEDHPVFAGSVRVAAAACKREEPVLLFGLGQTHTPPRQLADASAPDYNDPHKVRRLRRPTGPQRAAMY